MTRSATPERAARRIEGEAAAWVARAALGPLDQGQAAERAAWLAADPAHAQVHARLTGVLADAGSAEGVARAVDARARRKAAERARTLRAGGGVALALVAGVFAIDRLDPAPRFTDHHTAVGEVRGIALEDGSRLWLDARSAVDIDFDSSRREITLVQGQVYVQAAHEERPLSVLVAGGRIRDIGTAFVVRKDGDRAWVTVTEGRVMVRSADGVITLDAGRAGGFAKGARPRPSTPDPLPAAWRYGRLTVNGEPLSQVVAELNRYSRKPIWLLDDDRGRSVSGVVQLDALETSLPALARTQGLKVTNIGVAYVLTPSDASDARP
jgi:transmembrane sensor